MYFLNKKPQDRHPHPPFFKTSYSGETGLEVRQVLDLYVLFNSRLFIHKSEFWNYVERLIFFHTVPNGAHPQYY